MNHTHRARLAVLLLSLMSPVLASTSSLKLPLWKGLPPGGKTAPDYTETVLYRDNDPAKPRIQRVTEPTLEVFLPEPGKGCGSAVVICPGGAYWLLAYDHEGLDVARWFAERGVVGVVLKYRLPSDAIMADKRIGPLQDVQEALRSVRRHAQPWGIRPDRIGVMGFSAGGHLAASASTRYSEPVYSPADQTSARPDFSILVYGVISLQPDIGHAGSRTNLLGEKPSAQDIAQASNELRVDAKTPPAFLIHSQDDGSVPVENSVRYFLALKQHGIPAELHVHERGGHGYGLGVNPGSPAHWTTDLEAWMKRNGWM